MNHIDSKRLRVNETGDRYDFEQPSPHMAFVKSRKDGTVIRWTFDVAMTPEMVKRSIERDHERIERRMAKERGVKLPKVKKGDLVHHYNDSEHYSHVVGECQLEKSAYPCYAEKVHAKCAGDECEWFDYERYDIKQHGRGHIRTAKVASVENPPYYDHPDDHRKHGKARK